MTNEELIDKTDRAVSELVFPKYTLQKAYNYYNGIRDADQFKYLEEVFGTSTPTSINFTPLIRKHIDALVGEYLSMPIVPKVSCKDSDTISNIEREKQIYITSEIKRFLASKLQNILIGLMNGNNPTDTSIEDQIKKLMNDLSQNFTSEYEIAAQNVIDYIIQSRDMDLVTQLRYLILDLLITGYTFYKVEPTDDKNNVRIRVLNPLNTFIDRNIESPYVKNSYRSVVRTWLSKDEIIRKYGDKLSKKDKQLIKEEWKSIYDNALYFVRVQSSKCKGVPLTDGILAGIEVTPGYPTNHIESELIPVYEVEWLEVDEKNVMQRYETIRIGEEIYILNGKNDKVIRSVSNPSACTLSVNGVYFLNRSSEPYSLVLACSHLQDRFDLLTFYRDNLIANSGTVGDWIDETLIPSHLGVTMPERLAKWIALKKQGYGLLNSSEEGRLANGSAPLNTIFNGYDNTVKYQAIQAIQLALDSIEQTTSSITGVFRERLNGITNNDAVSNIKQGVNNSFIITKQYYHQMDLVLNEILLDSLNCAKVVYKKGLTGTLILGDKYQKIFTALPEYYTVTDHDVRVITSSELVKDLEQLKQIIPEFVKAGNLPSEIIIEAITCKSIPEFKKKLKEAIKKQQEENNQIQKLMQTNEELQNELKKLSSEAEKLQKKVESLNEEKLKLQAKEIELQNQIDWYKAKTDRTYKEAVVEEQKRRTEAEIAQMYDNNPYNDKIRNI